LSPAWPWPVPEPPPPLDEFSALAEELRAVRRQCLAGLGRPERGPFGLGREGRRALTEKLERVRHINAGLPHHRRSGVVARWASPVLPEGVLTSARDLLPLLDTGIAVVAAAAERGRPGRLP
jgi:hypothetical protein